MKCHAIFPFFAVLLAVGLAQRMVGGRVDADMNDAAVQDALQFAVLKHNEGSNNMYLSQVASMVRVQKQIVSGVNYFITVRMVRTNCRKNNTNEVCAIHPDPALAQPYTCTFTVWSQPWLEKMLLLKQEC
ncbi:cystatin-C-like [Solea solea]|uniref:cystatin-C-like n=1 Tax=Solea solea TaxID=90069 RepID=UPI00272A5484|nr:cystatin-C-like [Solea solea]